MHFRTFGRLSCKCGGCEILHGGGIRGAALRVSPATARGPNDEGERVSCLFKLWAATYLHHWPLPGTASHG